MEQSDLNKALRAFINNNDIEPWRAILQAVRDGDVQVDLRANTMTFRALPRPALKNLAASLRELATRSDKTYVMIANELDLSLSSVSRYMGGLNLPAWVVIRAIIECVGADPELYHRDYELARQEVREAARQRRNHLP